MNSYVRGLGADAGAEEALRGFQRFPQWMCSKRGHAGLCGMAAVTQLVELQRSAARYARGEGGGLLDDVFFAEQNARPVSNAERYHRSMFSGRASSWNLRDTHMADTIDELCGHLESQGRPAKIAVWAHNSHLGACRATEIRHAV